MTLSICWGAWFGVATSAPSSRLFSNAWLALCVLLAAGSLASAWLGNPPLLRWDSSLWPARPWTLFTSAWVHLSAAHLLANLLALGGLAWLGASLRLGPAAALAWLLAWPLGTLALLVWPQIGHYGGLSGPIHAGVGVIASWCAIYSIAKPWNFVIVCGLGLKLLSEAAWRHPVVFSPDWGFNLVLAAHLSGALAGLAVGTVVGLAAAARAAIRGSFPKQEA